MRSIPCVALAGCLVCLSVGCGPVAAPPAQNKVQASKVTQDNAEPNRKSTTPPRTESSAPAATAESTSAAGKPADATLALLEKAKAEGGLYMSGPVIYEFRTNPEAHVPTLLKQANAVSAPELDRGLALLGLAMVVNNRPAQYPTFPAVAEAVFKDSESGVHARAAAAYLLHQYRDTNPAFGAAWQAVLETGTNLEIQTAAANAIGYARAKEGIPTLIATLESKNDLLAVAAMRSLYLFEAEAQAAGPGLIRLALRKGPHWQEVVQSFDVIQVDPATCLPVLWPVLRDKRAWGRPMVFALAGKLIKEQGSNPAEYLAMVKEEFGPQGNAYLAVSACKALGPVAAPLVPELIVELKKSKSLDRFNVITALGEMGPSAKAAVPELLAGLDTDDAPMRTITVLGQIGEAPEFGAIAGKWLEQEQTRDDTLTTLAALGPQAEAAVPALLKVLKSEETYQRVLAVKALGAIGPGAKAAIPELKALADDKDLKEEVSAALAKIEK